MGTRLKTATVAPLCVSVSMQIGNPKDSRPLSCTEYSVLDGKESFGKRQVRKPACSQNNICSVLAILEHGTAFGFIKAR